MTRPVATPPPPAPRPAGLARRLAALCYDLLLLAAVLSLVTLATLLVRGGRAIDPGTLWFNLVLVLTMLVFFGGFWTHGGQTLGMAAWRLELRSADGGPVTLKQALIRFAAGWLTLLTAGLGFVAAAFDPRKRTLHDRLAGTIVVHHARATSVSADARPQSG